MLTEISISAMQTSAVTATARRDAKKPRRRSGTAISDCSYYHSLFHPFPPAGRREREG